MTDIAVVGAGAFGTALATRLGLSGHAVRLWALERDIADSINRDHENPTYLPGVDLSPAIRATADLEEATRQAEFVLLVCPAQYVRRVVTALVGNLHPGTPIITCSKGLELETGALMTEVVGELIPEAPVAALSGPTFAIEVAKGMRSRAALGSADLALARRLATAMSNTRFRAIPTIDVAGVQVGGAVKNVIAIACGMAQALGLGENARAVLMTAGVAEMTALARAKGGRAATVRGLSGLGDLALTCTSERSRNTRFGIAIGSGRTVDEVLAEPWPAVTEGLHTAAAVHTLCHRFGLDLPVCRAVYAVLYEGADPRGAIESLFA